MDCAQCGENLGGPRDAESGIAVMANGNEIIHSYFHCASCGKWTIEHYEDDFMTGDTSIWTTGPLDDSEGQTAVRLIEACQEPQNKHCRCPTHRALYTGQVGSSAPAVRFETGDDGATRCVVEKVSEADVGWLKRLLGVDFQLAELGLEFRGDDERVTIVGPDDETVGRVGARLQRLCSRGGESW